MSGKSLATLLIVVGVICAALGVFYLIPGPYHPLTFSGTPESSHKTHAIVLFAVAIFAIIGSRFARSSARG